MIRPNQKLRIIVGGLVGFNAGSVTTSGSTAPVSAVGNSYVGGLIGVNVGSVSSSQVDPQITAGANSVIGGIVGLLVGALFNRRDVPSRAQ